MFFFDPLYMLVMAVTMGLSLWATTKVRIAFAKYSSVQTNTGMTGADVATKLLKAAKVDVKVEPATKRNILMGGELSDHYDPREKVIRLSEKVYGSDSVAAFGVAAHEVGHAIQHATGYKLLLVRNKIAPVAAIGSNMAYVLIMMGFFISLFALVKIGILLFAMAVFFQIITVPVELDASRRAKMLLKDANLVSPAGQKGVAAVLDAAALTYIAAAATAVLNLAYLILRYRR